MSEFGCARRAWRADQEPCSALSVSGAKRFQNAKLRNSLEQLDEPLVRSVTSSAFGFSPHRRPRALTQISTAKSEGTVRVALGLPLGVLHVCRL